MLSLHLRVVAWTAALLPAVALATPLTLDEAVQRAAERSEAVRAARAGVASASEAARAAGQLPDPRLGVSVENLPFTGPDRFSTTRELMTMKRLALSQEWVSADKRALREAAASTSVARERTMAAVALADARLQAALAYVETWFAAENFKLGLENEHHAHESLQVAQGRLAAGGGNTPDVLALSSMQGIAADDAAEARQQLASAKVSLARWTGTPADEFSAPAASSRVDEQAFVERHPLVAAKEREIAMARGEAAVTASNRRPNWTWEVAYGQRTGMSDLVSVGVNIPLPIAPAARQDRETASKLALVDKAEGELAEVVRNAQAEYRTLTGDAARLAERIASIEKNVLAPARQRMTVSTAALAGNQASLAATLEARHAEFEARRKLLGLQRDLARVQAQLAFKPLRAEELQ